jgi:hypothetical protein
MNAAPGGQVAYWHVDDLDAMIARLLGLGAVYLDVLNAK